MGHSFYFGTCVAQRIRRHRAVLSLPTPLPFLFAACKSAGDACFVQNGDPLLAVVEAKDAASGAEIREVMLVNAKFMDSTLGDMSFLVDPSRAPIRQVVVEGQAIRCQIVCGLGSLPGDYEFTFAASGYRDTTFALRADYSEVTSRCPRFVKGSTSIALRLRKL